MYQAPDHKSPTNKRKALTLTETIVVLALLFAILPLIMAAMGTASRPNREAMCAFRLGRLGGAMLQYTAEHNQYLPGSPATSGAGLLYDYGDYPATSVDIPGTVTQVWDWAAPLATYLDIGEDLHPNRANRMEQLGHGKYWCPSNPFSATSYPPESAWPTLRMNSYLTMRQVFYCGEDATLDSELEDLARWPQAFATRIPGNYVPRLGQAGTPATKAFLSDGSRYIYGDGLIDYNVNHLACCGGAFSDGGPTLSDFYLHSYLRDPAELTAKSYRHSHNETMGINVAYFDAHVDWVSEPDSRHPNRWFPSGTVIPRTDMNRDTLLAVLHDLQGTNYIVP